VNHFAFPPEEAEFPTLVQTSSDSVVLTTSQQHPLQLTCGPAVTSIPHTALGALRLRHIPPACGISTTDGTPLFLAHKLANITADTPIRDTVYPVQWVHEGSREIKQFLQTLPRVSPQKVLCQNDILRQVPGSSKSVDEDTFYLTEYCGVGGVIVVSLSGVLAFVLHCLRRRRARPGRCANEATHLNEVSTVSAPGPEPAIDLAQFALPVPRPTYRNAGTSPTPQRPAYPSQSGAPCSHTNVQSPVRRSRTAPAPTTRDSLRRDSPSKPAPLRGAFVF